METVAAPYADREIAGVEPTDHALVAAVRRGDVRAFEQLFARYQRRIAAYVYGMVGDHGRAEDITQEIFISALRRMGETERPIAFKPWIYEIAKNACIDQFRRSRRVDEISYDADEGLGAADYGRLAERGPSPAAAVDQKQALQDLCGAFGGLSETHHQILVLRELEGLSYQQIGDRMGMTRTSVESTLFRARRRLSEEYDELASGERCLRVQALIGSAADGLLGARDSRRLARHFAHCQPCRREAYAAGVDAAVLSPRSCRAAARIAALFPFPALLRGRRPGGSEAGYGGDRAPVLAAHWSALAPVSEPLAAGWGKAAVAAATLVLAGLGAGVGSQIAPRPAPVSPPAVSAATKVAAPARSDRGSLRHGAVARPVPTRAAHARAGAGRAAGSRGSGSGVPLTSAPAASRRRPTMDPADGGPVAPQGSGGPRARPPVASGPPQPGPAAPAPPALPGVPAQIPARDAVPLPPLPVPTGAPASPLSGTVQLPPPLDGLATS